MQAEWKPEAPEKFGEIAELVKSVETLKIGETKHGDRLAAISLRHVSFFFPMYIWVHGFCLIVSAQGSKSSQSSTKTAPTPAQKPAAYRPPHAKTAAAVQAEVFIHDIYTSAIQQS